MWNDSVQRAVALINNLTKTKMKKCNAWTLGLLSVGLVSLPAVLQAEEKPSSVLTALGATTLSGYVDTSAQWNIGTGNANVPTYAWGGPGKADGFNLNVVKLSLEKPIDAADVWGAGYKVDLLAGPDASAFATQSTGTAADFAVKQAYVALHTPVGNGLDWKLGVWDTLIGYEVFESINNPNVTRSYGYTLEPTTHTGLQASYQINEMFAVNAAIADTFGPTINGRPFLGGGTTVPAGGEGPKAESFKTYMASVAFTAPTNWGALGGSTLSGCIINGFNPAIFNPTGTAPQNGGNGANQTSFYIGGTFNTPVTGLKAGVCYDYVGIAKQPNGVGSSYANAVGVYASYQITEKMSGYGRFEYATSDTAVLSSAGIPINILGARKVIETTATLQYDLWKNVLSRLEFRWDHAADDSNAYGGTIAGVGTVSNSYILLADIAYKF
jgi:hypothetical protein